MVRSRRIIFSLALMLLLAFAFSSTASAAVYVRGYFRKDGTYVAPHYRSYPDGNFWNNWSTYGNYNPYTGKAGTLRWPSSSYYRNYSWSYSSYWPSSSYSAFPSLDSDLYSGRSYFRSYPSYTFNSWLDY